MTRDPHFRGPGPRTRSALRDERGQTAAEYMGIFLVVAALLIAVTATPLGDQISRSIDATICKILGDNCEDASTDDVACPIRTTTANDKFSVGISVKAFSGEGGGERVVLKEEFDDGTARYTIIDRAALEVALGEGRSGEEDGTGGAGAGVLGVGGSLAAELAAGGVLEDASIYETESPEQTEEIDDALENSDGAEGALRGLEGGLDAPRDLFNKLSPVDVPDVDGFLFDQVFGDADLPEPDSEYVGGEAYVDAGLGASGDQGSDEAGAGGNVRAAAGGRHFTGGEREGETELYYKVEGSAAAELKSAVLGEANAGASGEVTVTLVLDENGVPKTLKLNGVGTATGLAESRAANTDQQLQELLTDSDSTEGKTVEASAELDLQDPENRQPVIDLLSPDPLTQAEGATSLVPQLLRGSDLQYAFYDTKKEEDTTDTDIVVASLSTEDNETVNTLTGLYRKPPGSTSFSEVDCDLAGD